MSDVWDIREGDRVTVVDSLGKQRLKVADSDVEGPGRHPPGRGHDFAGVYVREPDGEPGDGIFWPIEDITVGWDDLPDEGQEAQ